jgi:hypothetical protein
MSRRWLKWRRPPNKFPGDTPATGSLSRPVGALTTASSSSSVSLRANSPVRAAANSLSVRSPRVFAWPAWVTV